MPSRTYMGSGKCSHVFLPGHMVQVEYLPKALLTSFVVLGVLGNVSCVT